MAASVVPKRRSRRRRAVPQPAVSFREGLLGSSETGAVRDAIAQSRATGTVLRDLRSALGLTIAEVAAVLGVGERTLIRKEQSGGTLSAAEADRAYRIARIADLAVELIGDREKARSWLKTPHRYLGGESPIAMLETEVGTELTVQSLYAIAYGGTA